MALETGKVNKSSAMKCDRNMVLAIKFGSDASKRGTAFEENTERVYQATSLIGNLGTRCLIVRVGALNRGDKCSKNPKYSCGPTGVV